MVEASRHYDGLLAKLDRSKAIDAWLIVVGRLAHLLVEHDVGVCIVAIRELNRLHDARVVSNHKLEVCFAHQDRTK